MKYEKSLITVLNKIYSPTNSIYNGKDRAYTYELPQDLTSKQIEVFKNSGFELNKITTYTHEETAQKLREIVKDDSLEQKVLHLFFRIFARGEPRGIQSMYSYYFAKHLPVHSFTPFEDAEVGEYKLDRCKISGLKKEIEQNDAKNLYEFYIGYSSFYGCANFLLDLQEVQNSPLEEIDENDINAFRNLCEFIEGVDEKVTYSKLESLISKAKILKGSTRTSRTWLIHLLANLGVLNIPSLKQKTILKGFTTYKEQFLYELELHKNSKVEVVFPTSLWRGADGVNKEVMEELILKVE